MTGASDRKARRSADLLGTCHRDEPRAPARIHQPLRQTEGLLQSIADVLKIDIAIPDHTTLSRRGGGLTVLPKRIDRAEPLHLLVDSTGLKIYGEGEWLDQKHGIRSRRRWRKLHLGVDSNTHEVVAVELTLDDVGDVAEVPALLDQIGADVASMTADGAYRWPGRLRRRCRASSKSVGHCSAPDHSRFRWNDSNSARQASHDYCRVWTHELAAKLSLVETTMFRYKTVVGRRLHARALPKQRIEAKVGCNVLNRMTGLGMPVSTRIR